MIEHAPHGGQTAIEEVLGYLNFSSGKSDPKFLRGLNDLFAPQAAAAEPWRLVLDQLRAGLRDLQGRSPAFRNAEQAEAVLQVVAETVLPAYLEHHRDLLFHQRPGALLGPFFLGRVFEATLLEGPPWEEGDRIRAGALKRLNDFIGHRPVAVLETEQKIEPYPHERVRPVPLFIAGAGVAAGRYQAVVEQTLEILRQTSPEVLESAWFDLEALEELAYDPRAYDFNHPVNKRPNYHFGQWDPHHIDGRGRYRRFVIQQVTLDALLERAETAKDRPDLRLFEAAAVMAGTLLMASGTSGSGPDTHDSSTTLSSLLPRIAAYRDAFYSQLLERTPEAFAGRLRAEAARLKQPFGGARQHLNQQLAKRRAAQLQHVLLGLLFARMGYPEAAIRQANIAPAPSARMMCLMHCLLAKGFEAVRRGRPADALSALTETKDLLRRAIDCGAVVDPWNIIGFGGQFSLFPAAENSVPDPRVDELIDLMEQIFELYSRAWSEAAVAGDEPLQERLQTSFQRSAAGWDRFATPLVGSVKRIAGLEMLEGARHVADALSAWHQAGAAAGDTAFWRLHGQQFDSPRAYARVVETLLDKGDLSAAMSLLIHWVSQAGRVGLEDGNSSFHTLALHWLDVTLQPAGQGAGEGAPAIAEERLSLARKFLDYLEANAEEWWEPPQLDLDEFRLQDAMEEMEDLLSAEPDEDEAPESLFGAAYDDVIYRDSTADGLEGEMLEFDTGATEHELEQESKRLAKRLSFLTTVARLWSLAAAGHAAAGGEGWRHEALAGWRKRANGNRRRLAQLLRGVQNRTIAEPSANQDSLVEYDRQLMIKDTLLERIMASYVAIGEAEAILNAVLRDEEAPSKETAGEAVAQSAPLWRVLLYKQTTAAPRQVRSFMALAAKQPLLYLPLSKGGDPARIVAARSWQQMFRLLFAWLPRAGLLRETCQLIRTARNMEADHPLGPGAVTEFHRLYEVGFKAMVESMIDASLEWGGRAESRAESFDGPLVHCLRRLTESLLGEWLAHSRTLRLSSLEKVAGDAEFTALAGFIQRYGGDIFTQRFLNIGNLRAILHQGVDQWLKRLQEDPDPPEWRLLQELDKGLQRSDAVQHLSLAIEAIVENYAEYRDYNSTTTQSDRGELLYILLDFLRLKAAYDRVSWNLRPVVMAHEVLVRRGRTGAAEIWRQAMAERAAETASTQITRLGELETKYGMRLATVGDRLSERFVRPLAIDRLRALVKPAVEEARGGAAPQAFKILEHGAEELARQTTGAGLDVPDWLTTIEDEVDRVCVPLSRSEEPREKLLSLPRVTLSINEIEKQLASWDKV